MTPTTDHTDSSSPGSDSPWTRPGFVVSAVLVGLIVLAGIVLTVLNLTDKPPSPGSAPPPPAVPGAPQGAPTGGSACGLPAGDQTVPRVAPANSKWQLIGTIAAPTAPATYGPGRTTNGVPTCFAHSPTGALYAATNFVATSSDPRLVPELVRVSGTGPGQAAASAQAATASQDATDASSQLAGFNVLNYGSDSATVDLLFRGATTSTNGYAHFVAPMAWVEGTWKWTIPPSGNPYENTQAVPNPAGYVLWSGA